MEYTTPQIQKDMHIANQQVENYFIKDERLAAIFSFLAFTFMVAVFALFVGLLFNLSIIYKLVFLSSLFFSIVAGVGINRLDKYLLWKKSQAQLEQLLGKIE